MANPEFDYPNPFVSLLNPEYQVPLTQTQRLTRLATKGATLGFTNKDVKAEGLLEHGVEFAGSIPTVVGLSAIGSPALAAGARFAKLAPLSRGATRLGTAAGIGALTGTAKAIETGDITEVPTDIALNAAAEGLFMGGGKVLRALRGGDDALQKTLKETATVVPETPPMQTKESGFFDPFMPGAAPEENFMPSTAYFGPNISADGLTKRWYAENTTTPVTPGRVPLHHYGQLADEYGNPVPVAPETQFSVERTPNVMRDEYGAPLDDIRPPVYSNVTLDQLDKMFQVRPSPDGSAPIMTPLSKDADDLVQALRASQSPRHLEMQFTADQLEYFKKDGWNAIRGKFDAEALKRENLTTSNIVKKSADEVEKIVADPANDVKVVEDVVIRKTKDGLLVERLARKNGQTVDDAAAIERDAIRRVLDMKLQNPKSYPVALENEILRLLQERCK